jgi:protein SCO1/2
MPKQQKSNSMLKKLFIPLVLLVFLFNVKAQLPKEDDIEIGIVEKLGDTIPLDLSFLNEKNDTVYLRDLIDKPTILSFVYFDCPGICSPLLNGVSEVVQNMDMVLGKDYQIITISFNTKDTPEKAAIKKQNFVLKISKENQENWIYLTGEQKNINIITEAAGFRYKPQGLDFAHPAAIIMLSPEGKITRYLYGMSFLPFDVKMAIIEAQKGLARPTINKILEYCFAYDPTSRTYALQVTRIVGGFILAILIIVFTTLLIKGRKKILAKNV